MKQDKLFWITSAVVSFIFFILIANIWYQSSTSYQPETERLNNTTEVKEFLIKHWENNKTHKFTESPLYLPTGIYVQSIYFVNPYTVQLTGYIWQRYNKKLHTGLTRNVIFADSVDAKRDDKRVIYHYTEGDEELIGWHFETSIRQNFSYNKYPLDHKTILIRLWPYDFSRDVMLTPDFAAYDSTTNDKTFGINDELVLPGFHLRDTFFKYVLTNYDSNFGVLNYVGQKQFPELAFNIVITRKVLQGMVFHLLPLSAVIVLLFLLLLITTHDEKKLELFKFSTSANIAGSGGLFFILVLANIRVREQFSGSDIVYIEYFFILTYFIIVCVALNGFLFNSTKSNLLIQYHDNLLPKVLYWPLILGSLLLVTLLII